LALSSLQHPTKVIFEEVEQRSIVNQRKSNKEFTAETFRYVNSISNFQSLPWITLPVYNIREKMFPRFIKGLQTKSNLRPGQHMLR
jgi:hypothetical protein